MCSLQVSDSDNEFKYESHRQLFDTKQEWMNNASLRINVTNDKVQAKVSSSYNGNIMHYDWICAYMYICICKCKLKTKNV